MQLKERSIKLYRHHDRLAHMKTSINQLLLENKTMRRELRKIYSCLEDMQKTSKITKEYALPAFFSKFYSVSLELLIDLPPMNVTILWPEPSSTPSNNPPTVPATSTPDRPWSAPRVAIRNSNPLNNCLRPNLFQPPPNFSGVLWNECCRQPKRQQCSRCCSMNDFGTSGYWQ